MHCYICDKNMNEVRIDPRDKKPRPCSECEEVILEAVFEMDEEAIVNKIESELNEYDEETHYRTRDADLGNT